MEFSWGSVVHLLQAKLINTQFLWAMCLSVSGQDSRGSAIIYLQLSNNFPVGINFLLLYYYIIIISSIIITYYRLTQIMTQS